MFGVRPTKNEVPWNTTEVHVEKPASRGHSQSRSTAIQRAEEAEQVRRDILAVIPAINSHRRMLGLHHRPIYRAAASPIIEAQSIFQGCAIPYEGFYTRLCTNAPQRTQLLGGSLRTFSCRG